MAGWVWRNVMEGVAHHRCRFMVLRVATSTVESTGHHRWLHRPATPWALERDGRGARGWFTDRPCAYFTTGGTGQIRSSWSSMVKDTPSRESSGTPTDEWEAFDGAVETALTGTSLIEGFESD